MSEWAYTRIRDLLETSYAGDWGTTPLPGNARILRATDIDSDGRINGQGALRQISPATIQAKRLQSGDIMLEASGGSPEKPVGRVAFFFGEERATPFLTSNFYKTLRPSKNTNARFLHWALLRFYRQPEILQFQQQTTGIINLKFQDYLDASICTPRSVKEQRLIARILDTLDTQIQKTEALIAKLEKVKEGLLHDLLTRGIDENGRLRPRYEQAPELYKESPLGLIPREWETKKISDLSTKVTNGFVGVATPHYTESLSGVTYLYGNNIRKNRIDFSRHERVTQAFHKSQVKSQLKNGDMLTVQSGHIGTSAVYDSSAGEANCHALIITRFIPSRVNSRFVSLYLNSALGMLAQSRLFIGSTILHINTSDLAKLVIPAPSLNEQARVVDHFLKIENRLQLEVGQRDSLVKLKQGLMDDLLTGRVRVTPLLDTT